VSQIDVLVGRGQGSGWGGVVVGDAGDANPEENTEGI